MYVCPNQWHACGCTAVGLAVSAAFCGCILSPGKYRQIGSSSGVCCSRGWYVHVWSHWQLQQQDSPVVGTYEPSLAPMALEPRKAHTYPLLGNPAAAAANGSTHTRLSHHPN